MCMGFSDTTKYEDSWPRNRIIAKTFNSGLHSNVPHLHAHVSHTSRSITENTCFEFITLDSSVLSFSCFWDGSNLNWRVFWPPKSAFKKKKKIPLYISLHKSVKHMTKLAQHSKPLLCLLLDQKWAKFFSKGQVVEISGFVGHIQSMLHILLFFNVKTVLSLGAEQKHITGWIWCQGCSLFTLSIEKLLVNILPYFLWNFLSKYTYCYHYHYFIIKEPLESRYSDPYS